MFVQEPPEGLEDLAGLELAWPSADDTLHPRRGVATIRLERPTGFSADMIRAEGFRAAAELMFSALTQVSPDEKLVYPYANCWRHSIELQLKILLPDLQRITYEPVSDVSKFGHDLLSIWRAARPLLERTFPPDDDTRWVERLLAQLHAIDPDGQNFRYSTTIKGKPTLARFKKVEIERFHGSLMGVASFLDAAAQGVWSLESFLEQ